MLQADREITASWAKVRFQINALMSTGPGGRMQKPKMKTNSLQ